MKISEKRQLIPETFWMDNDGELVWTENERGGTVLMQAWTRRAPPGASLLRLMDMVHEGDIDQSEPGITSCWPMRAEKRRASLTCELDTDLDTGAAWPVQTMGGKKRGAALLISVTRLSWQTQHILQFRNNYKDWNLAQYDVIFLIISSTWSATGSVGHWLELMDLD